MRFTRFLHVVAAFILIACAALPARAQTTLTWSGTGSAALWNDGGNWSSGVAPLSGGTNGLVFAGTTLLTSTNNIDNLSVSSISFANTTVGSGGFLLSGSTIILRGGITTTALGSGSVTDEINLGMVITGANLGITMATPASHNLKISGSIGQDSSPRSVTKSGNSTLTLSNTNNSFATLAIQAGNVNVTQIGTAGLTSQTGTGSSISGQGNLIYTGAGETSDKTFVNGYTNNNSNGFTLQHDGASGALNFTGSTFAIAWAGSTVATRSMTIQGSNTADNTIAGTLADATSGPTTLGLTKAGVGKWILSGSNTYTGATAVTNGTLQIGSGGTTGSLNPTSAISVSSGATLVFSRSDTIKQGDDFNSRISGRGDVTQLGPGTLILSGSNTYTGATAVNAGTLRVASNNGLSFGGQIYINNTAASATVRPTGSGVTQAVMDLNGNITVNKPIVLTGTANTAQLINSAVGTTAVLDNGVAVANFTNGGSGYSLSSLNSSFSLSGGGGAGATAAIAGFALSGSSVSITNGGAGWSSGNTITVSGGGATTNATYTVTASGGAITGLTLTSGGVGFTTLSGLTFTGAKGTAGASGSNATFSTNDGTLAASSISMTAAGSGYTTSPSISPSGGSGFVGTSTLSSVTLSGANNQIGGDGNLSIKAIIGQSASGAGFTKIGGGILTLSASNTYTGTTTVNAGTLTADNAGALGSGGDITFTGGTLQYTANSANQDWSSRIKNSGSAISIDTNSQTVSLGALASSNTGGLTKAGAGTLTLSGSNGYTGTTTVLVGTLALGASNVIPNQSNLLVNGGGFNLAGYSDTVGAVTLMSGSIFGSGTLGGSSYALQGGALNAVLGSGAITVSTGTTTLGSAGRFNAGSGLTISSGQLTLGGNETVASYSQSGGTLGGSGTVTAATYGLGGGTVSANLGSGTVTVTANSTLNGTSGANTVNLNAGTLTLGSGGTRFASSSVAVSGSAGASLTLGGNETFGSLAGAANVALGGNTLSVGAANGDMTYSGVLSGNGGLTKVGSGALTLANANTYSGATTISSGTVIASVAGAISGNSAITIGSDSSRGFLKVDDSLTISSLTFTGSGGDVGDPSDGMVTFSSSSGTASITVLSGSNKFHANATLGSPTLVNVSNGAYFSFHNNLSGGSSLTKSGSGTMNLTGDNDTLSGNLFITGGLVTIGGGMNQLGSGTTTLSNGSTIDLNGFSFTDRIVVLNGTILNAGGTATTTTIAGISTIGGTTAQGTYNITSTGSALFNVAVGDGAAAVNVSVNNGGGSGGRATFAQAIGANGSVTVLGGGTATFNGTMAGYVISHGASTLNGNVLSGAEVQVNSGTAGTGSALFAANVAATVTVESGAAAEFRGLVSGPTTISGSAFFTSASGLTGSLDTNPGGLATLDNIAAEITGSIHNDGLVTINRASDSQTISGLISGSGSIVKQGGGTLVLTGVSNSFSGSTEIAAGKIQIGNGGTAGSLGGAITNNGELVFNRTDSYGGAYGNAITGSGLVRLLSGSLTLSGSNGYSGGTWIDGGTLTAGHVKAFGSGMITLGSGATLDLANYLVTNAITNNGGTIRGGTITGEVSGTTTLTSGQTTFDSTIGAGAQINVAATGTAEFGNGASFNEGAKVVNDGIMRVSRSVSGTLAIGAIVSGSGRLQIDSGKARLDAANTYTGNTVITGSGSVLALGAGGSFDNSPTIVVGNAGSIGAVLDLTAQGGAGNTFTFNADQKLMGKGTIDLDGATLRVLGTLAPGNSPGNLTINGNLAWQTTDAGYQWEINNAMGTAGTNWDLLTVTGVLDLSALSATNKYLLDLTTLTSSNTAGLMDNYVDGNNYTWSLVTASSVLLASGTAAAGTDITDLFTLSFANWANTKPSAGNYSVKVASDGAGINLVIIPEPDTIIFAGIGIAMAGWSLWKRRRITQILRRPAP